MLIANASVSDHCSHSRSFACFLPLLADYDCCLNCCSILNDPPCMNTGDGDGCILLNFWPFSGSTESLTFGYCSATKIPPPTFPSSASSSCGSTDCCDDGTEHEPLKTSLSMVDQVGNGDVCGGKICRDGLSLLPGGPIHPSINAATAPVAVNGNGGLSNGSLHHHHHHHIIECGEKDALFNPDLDMESETGSTVGVSCYNEDRLSINLEESKFGKYGPSNNGCVYNSTTTTSQSNLTKTSTTQYHHHHVNVSNGGAPIIKHNGI